MTEARTSPATVSLGEDGRIAVEGCLDVDTVAKCRDDGIALLPEDEDAKVVFDLSATDVRGSAPIALLIAWQRELRGRNGQMSVVGAPDALLDIADACGVREIVPFDL